MHSCALSGTFSHYRPNRDRPKTVQQMMKELDSLQQMLYFASHRGIGLVRIRSARETLRIGEANPAA
jgi:hypothetical protein